MLMFIPPCGILLLIRLFAVITKYTVLDEQRHEAKEGKSQRKNHRSITRGTYNMLAVNASTVLALRSVFSKVNKHTTDQDISLKFSH